MKFVDASWFVSVPLGEECRFALVDAFQFSLLEVEIQRSNLRFTLHANDASLGLRDLIAVGHLLELRVEKPDIGTEGR